MEGISMEAMPIWTMCGLPRQPIAFVLLLGDYCGSLFAVNAFCRIDMRVLQSPGKNAVI